MATISGIRGMLLEEALLFLLKETGYKTIENPSSEPELLHLGPSGMELNGRGGKHQIDAIADFYITPPFSNKLRLLLEAKCFAPGEPVGIEIIRNAIGVLKDVNEFWVTRSQGVPAKNRYHYQYAIFSSSGYTKNAEKFAYAHDIYLINLNSNAYFESILKSIWAITPETFNSISKNQVSIRMSELRQSVRSYLEKEITELPFFEYLNQFQHNDILEFIKNCRLLGKSFLAMIGNRFPVLLSPAPLLNIENISALTLIRIVWHGENWFITDTNGNHLFSFNLPLELLSLYQKEGFLEEKKAINMKEQMMSEIQIIYRKRDTEKVEFEVKKLNLDMNWLKEIQINNR
jgi:hypothetical protein